jgi:hypothetical protein
VLIAIGRQQRQGLADQIANLMVEASGDVLDAVFQ